MNRFYIIIIVWIKLTIVMSETSFWDGFFYEPDEDSLNNPNLDTDGYIPMDDYVNNDQLERQKRNVPDTPQDAPTICTSDPPDKKRSGLKSHSKQIIIIVVLANFGFLVLYIWIFYEIKCRAYYNKKFDESRWSDRTISRSTIIEMD